MGKLIEAEGIRSANLIGEIEKISELDLSYKYRMILIKGIIEAWRNA